MTPSTNGKAQAGAIVVATDLSAGAAAAVERAAHLARRSSTPLWLLHVFNDSLWATVKGIYNVGTWNVAEPQLVARQRLSELADEVAARYGIAAFAETAIGRAAAAIAEFVVAKEARLVVVGAHGENLVRDIVLGGTALKVLEKAPIPVVLVRRPVAGDYAQVLVGTDFSPGAAGAVRLALALFPEAGCTLLHAYSVPFEGRMHLAGTSDADIERFRENERIAAAGRMDGFVAAMGARPRLVTRLQLGYPAATIIEQAVQLGADLVAVGRHSGGKLGERLLGSVTRNVLYHAGCDVLVAP